MEPEEKGKETKSVVFSDTTETKESEAEASVDNPTFEVKLPRGRNEDQMRVNEESSGVSRSSERSNEADVSSQVKESSGSKGTEFPVQPEATASTSTSKLRMALTRSKVTQKSESGDFPGTSFSKERKDETDPPSRKKTLLIPEFQQSVAKFGNVSDFSPKAKISQKPNVAPEREFQSPVSLEESACDIPTLQSASHVNVDTPQTVVEELIPVLTSHMLILESQGQFSNVLAPSQNWLSENISAFGAMSSERTSAESPAPSSSSTGSSEVRSIPTRVSTESPSDSSESRKFINEASISSSAVNVLDSDFPETSQSQKTNSPVNKLPVSESSAPGTVSAEGVLEESLTLFISKGPSEVSSTTDSPSQDSESKKFANEAFLSNLESNMSLGTSADCSGSSTSALKSPASDVLAQGTSESHLASDAVSAERTSAQRNQIESSKGPSNISSTTEMVSTESSSEDSELRRINEASLDSSDLNEYSGVSRDKSETSPSHETRGPTKKVTFEGTIKSSSPPGMASAERTTGGSSKPLESLKESSVTQKTVDVSEEQENESFQISSASDTPPELSPDNAESLSSHKSESSNEPTSEEMTKSSGTGSTERTSGESSALFASSKGSLEANRTTELLSTSTDSPPKDSTPEIPDNDTYMVSSASNTPTEQFLDSPTSLPSDESEGPANKVPRLQ